MFSSVVILFNVNVSFSTSFIFSSPFTFTDVNLYPNLVFNDTVLLAFWFTSIIPCGSVPTLDPDTFNEYVIELNDTTTFISVTPAVTCSLLFWGITTFPFTVTLSIS